MSVTVTAAVYNKLFTSILDSSVWLETTATRIVWITFLAAMDEDGFVRMATVQNLSIRARVSEMEAQQAVDALEAIDELCPDQDFQGRRIERVEGGWIVLNARKYREIVNRETQREQTKIRVAKLRARRAAENGDVTHVTLSNENVTTSEAEAAAEAEANRGRIPPSKEEVALLIAKAGLPPEEAEKFWNFHEAGGWMRGKSKMKSVSGAVGYWACKYREFHSQAPKPINPTTQAMIHRDELKIVDAKIDSIRNSYSEHQSCSKEDREKWDRLKARKVELKQLLGMQV